MATFRDRSLEEELELLGSQSKNALHRHSFDPQQLFALTARMLQGSLENKVKGRLEHPTDDDVVSLPAPGSPEEAELRRLGEEALRRGECALVVLAGGMATRMGGVVKALVEALPGQTFLDLRLREQAHLESKYGARPPLWLMTSHATDPGIREALGERQDGNYLATFVQGLSVRLNPDGSLFRDESGEPSLYSPGHGDLPESLKKSGLLAQFLERGGRYVLVTNLDNLGGGLDPVLIGLHVSQEQPVTCEVVDKLASDRGGIPVRLDGKPVVLEEFRIPEGFDPNAVRVFNVNSFGFDARALHELELDWSYFVVQKKVDGKTAIQFERLINEVTFHLPTRYLRVPRSGGQSRFLPVKDHDELAARRSEISELARLRGMLAES